MMNNKLVTEGRKLSELSEEDKHPNFLKHKSKIRLLG